MTCVSGLMGVVAGAVLRAVSVTAGVVLLARPPDGVLWWLTGCWMAYEAGTALGGASLVPAAQARDRRARCQLLTAVQSLAVSPPDPADCESLGAHLYAAAGVAIRWEPKPSAAVTVQVRVADSALVLAGLCGALATVSPPLAAASAGCTVLAVVLALHPRVLPTRGAGAAGWRSRRRRGLARTALVGVLAAAGALAPALGALRQPHAVAGLLGCALLFAHTLYGLAAVDPTAVRHWRATRHHLREVGRAAAEVRAADLAGVARSAPRSGPSVLVPARPTHLGFADLAENVHLGALGPGESVSELLPRTVRLCRLDTLAGTLPQGWHTVLSAEFSGGVDPDGDTWRRIGAARVSALLELGATEVRLSGAPDPLLSEVLAAWGPRVRPLVRNAGAEGPPPAGSETRKGVT